MGGFRIYYPIRPTGYAPIIVPCVGSAGEVVRRRESYEALLELILEWNTLPGLQELVPLQALQKLYGLHSLDIEGEVDSAIEVAHPNGVVVFVLLV